MLRKVHAARGSREREENKIEYFTLNNGIKMPMAEIAKVDKGVRCYTATLEMIAAYTSMELKEDL